MVHNMLTPIRGGREPSWWCRYCLASAFGSLLSLTIHWIYELRPFCSIRANRYVCGLYITTTGIYGTTWGMYVFDLIPVAIYVPSFFVWRSTTNNGRLTTAPRTLFSSLDALCYPMCVIRFFINTLSVDRTQRHFPPYNIFETNQIHIFLFHYNENIFVLRRAVTQCDLHRQTTN